MTDKEAMKLALEAMKNQIANVYDTESNAYKKCAPAITALEQRLAQPEKEPVAWRYGALLYHDKLDAMEFIRTSGDSYLLEPLYTHPPQRKPLTDEQIADLYFDGFSISKLKDFARAIEAAHGITKGGEA